jgi:hypothetical protein
MLSIINIEADWLATAPHLRLRRVVLYTSNFLLSLACNLQNLPANGMRGPVSEDKF